VPLDGHQRLRHHRDRAQRGYPQQPFIVFGVPPGNVLVDRPGREPRGPTHEDRAGVYLHDSVRQQVVQLDRGGPARPVACDSRPLQPDPAGDRAVLRVGEQHVDLTAQLVRVPGVVVIAERQEVTGRGRASAVTATRQARAAGVGQHDRPPRLFRQIQRAYRHMVENHQALDVPRIVLAQDLADRPLQQTGSIPGRDHHTDRRVRRRGGPNGGRCAHRVSHGPHR